MAGEHHDIVVELLRSEPAPLVALLRARGLRMPRRVTALALERSARQLRPVEFTADLVLRLAWGRERSNIIVEVQRRPDADKRRSWPLYFAHLRATAQGPVELVVIATNHHTAAWAREPIVAASGRSRFEPLVFGPDDVPVIATAQEALAAPRLAMLSALVHLEHEARVTIAAHAVRAWHDAVDATGAGLYLDALVAELGACDGQKLLEAVMQGREQPYRSDFGRVHYERGIEQGIERGLEQGIERGLEQGKAEGLALAVLSVLSTRGVAVDDAARERITTCTDTATLQAWLERAVRVGAVDALFAP